MTEEPSSADAPVSAPRGADDEGLRSTLLIGGDLFVGLDHFAFFNRAYEGKWS